MSRGLTKDVVIAVVALFGAIAIGARMHSRAADRADAGTRPAGLWREGGGEITEVVFMSRDYQRCGFVTLPDAQGRIFISDWACPPGAMDPAFAWAEVVFSRPVCAPVDGGRLCAVAR